MKFTVQKIFVITLLGFLSNWAVAQPTFDYQIARWKGFKQSALSLTFDDNLSGQFTYALDTMEKYGYRGTLFVITSQVNWNDATDAHNRGHEIGSHTVTHPHLKQLDSASIYPEIANAYQAIKQNVPGAKAISIAWPYGEGGGSSAIEHTIRNITQNFHYFGRNASSGSGYDPFWHFNNSWFDRYFLQNGAYLIQSNTTANNITSTINNCMADSGRINLLYHAIETNGYAKVTKEVFGEHLQAIASHKDSLWVATFGEVSLYQRNWVGASVSLVDSSANGNQWQFDFEITNPNTQNTDLYYPLTVRLGLPISLATCGCGLIKIDSVVQNNQKIDHQGTFDHLIVNVTPNLDSGKFKVYVSYLVSSVGQLAQSTKQAPVIFPNPTSNKYFTVKATGALQHIEITDISGKTLLVVNAANAQQNQISVEATNLHSGLYFVRVLQRNGQISTEKVLIK